MGIITTPKTEIEKYFQSDRLSQSTLKQLSSGLDNFLSEQEKDEDKKSFTIGSAVDCMLTGNETFFLDEYYVSHIEKKPSQVEMNIIQSVFDSLTESLTASDNIQSLKDEVLSNCIGDIETAVDEFAWQPRWKKETRVNKIIEIGSEYFEDLKKAYGKKIISSEEFKIILDIAESLETNPRTSEYFDRHRFEKMMKVEVYYQLPIYFNYKGVDCKALLDMVIVFKNPQTRKIESVQPIDLKTMYGYTSKFIINLKKFRYDIQAAWYTMALQYWMKEQNYTPEDYMIKPFLFIVESTSNIGKPLVYRLTEEFLKIGKEGIAEVKVNDVMADNVTGNPVLQKEVKGFDQLLEEYLFYSNTEWKEDIAVTQNLKNGVLDLDWNGIVTK